MTRRFWRVEVDALVKIQRGKEIMNCKNCTHYHFYQMITGGPYGYSGDIPCTRCSRFASLQDNYVPIQPDTRTLTEKTQDAQVEAGERAVMDNLKSMGF